MLMKRKLIIRTMAVIMAVMMTVLLLPNRAMAAKSEENETDPNAVSDDEAMAALRSFCDRMGIDLDEVMEDVGSTQTSESTEYEDATTESPATTDTQTIEQREVQDPSVSTYTVSFVADGKVVDSRTLSYGDDYGEAPEAPEKSGYIFTGWFDENSSPFEPTKIATQDIIFMAQYVSEKDAIPAEKLFFPAADLYCEIDEVSFTPDYSFGPANAQDRRMTWKSSDENTAIVNEKGQVMLKATGTVTIIGTLKNGFAAGYKLHILENGAMADADKTKLTITTKAVSLDVDGYEQIKYTVTPEYGLTYFSCTTPNTDVITVDSLGVIHAIAPGTATVIVHDVISGADAEIKVTVTDPNATTETPTTETPTTETPTTDTPTTESATLSYDFTKGKEAVYSKGDKNGLVLTVERSQDNDKTLSHFKEVQVDGATLSILFYTVENGSVKLTIRPEYLDQLQEGTHRVLLVFDDGQAETTFTITVPQVTTTTTTTTQRQTDPLNNNTTNNGVKTGDNRAPFAAIVFIISLFLFITVFVGIAIRKKMDS